MPALNEPAALCARLARAVTYDYAIESATLDDDLRMIRHVGAKFLGRAAFVWGSAPDDEEHLAQARRLAQRVHAMDPDIVLQAAFFEYVDRGADRVPIPAWVFAKLGEPAANRCFSSAEIRGPEFGDMFRWGPDGGVPDIRQAEARRWFVYRCCRYIDAGFEAIHLGQPHLYARRDEGYAAFQQVIAIVRDHAAKQARRGAVLLDAHTHGFGVHGRLLLDFHSMPISVRPDLAHPERLILQNRCASLGGITPAGETCANAPQLIEVDNYGGLLGSGPWKDEAERANTGRWGYDDIAWLAHQPAAERDHFLRYAHAFYRLAGSNIYFQPPLRRTLGRAARATPYYQANRPSPACPDGFGQEDAIAECFASAPPVWLADYHRRVEEAGPREPAVDRRGIAVNEPVVLLGSIQVPLGGWLGDPSCVYSRLRRAGGGVYELAAVVPWAGEFDITVALGGTLTDLHRQEGLAGGPPWRLVTRRDNTVVWLRFDHATRLLTALDERGERLL